MAEVDPSPGRLMRAVDAFDGHPALTTLLTAGFLYGGLSAWSALASSDVLLARAEPARRTAIYGQFASTSVAILAVSLTVLAILYALPDRDRFAELRDSSVWPRLQGLLLAIALLCVTALVCAHLGTAIDHSNKGGIEWLEHLMLASSAVAIIAALIAGATLTLVLSIGHDPPDPARGRGQRGQ